MKKLYTIIFLALIITKTSLSQALIETHFDGYIGTTATIPTGWYISWNSDTTQTTLSYYTTSGNCGLSCPAYKFGIDSALMISPPFANADSLRFFLKGNGTPEVINSFEVYSSPDSSNWNLEMSMDSIPASGNVYTIPLDAGATHVAFLYNKDSLGYNAGLDDVYIFAGTLNVGLQTINEPVASVFPNPTQGLLNIQLSEAVNSVPKISVFNLLGAKLSNLNIKTINSKLYTLDLGNQPQGLYLVKVESANGTMTKRITLK